MTKRRLPPLNALVAFEAAARHLHFGMAAEELSVTHGAISKQVRHLEETLGIALFDRIGSRVQLTIEGGRLLASATAALDQISRAQRDVIQGGLRGTIRVSCESVFASEWLAPRLNLFISQHPEIEFHLLASNDPESVYEPSIDLSIRFGAPTWPDREVVHLADFALFPVCTPDLLHGTQAIDHPSDLRAHVLLHDDTNEKWGRYLARTGVTSIELSRGVYFHDYHSLLAAARSGLGVALGDLMTCDQHLSNGSIVRLFPKNIDMIDSYYMVTQPTEERTEACDAFVLWLLQQVKELGRFDPIDSGRNNLKNLGSETKLG